MKMKSNPTGAKKRNRETDGIRQVKACATKRKMETARESMSSIQSIGMPPRRKDWFVFRRMQ
jgi:hypothetical protein